jgi:LacI family transcriptional regulator
MHSSVTIRDVAIDANVSIATVSNVINGKGRVSKETISKVKESIDRLNYYPNISARTMKKKESKLIAVIVPFENEEGNIHDNPFYWSILSSIEKCSKEKGFYTILIGMTENQNHNLDFIKERNIDGVIVIGAAENDPTVKFVREYQTPNVFIDSYLLDEEVFQVFLDDKQGGYMGAKHLLNLRHEKIIVIGGSREKHGVMNERMEGVYTAFKQAELARNKVHYIDAPVSMRGGYDAGTALSEIYGATAVFCLSDIIALGLLKYLNEHNIRVPEDYSVIGFDNISSVAYSSPALTTISQDTVRKGRVAVELLMSQINDDKIEQKKYILPASVKIRESTKTNNV